MSAKLAPVSPAQFVVNTLEAAGHPNPLFWIGKEFTLDDLNSNPELAQRLFINRRLRLAVVDVEADTTNFRYCLIDECLAEDWKRMYLTAIFKFLAEHKVGY